MRQTGPGFQGATSGPETMKAKEADAATGRDPDAGFAQDMRPLRLVFDHEGLPEDGPHSRFDCRGATQCCSAAWVLPQNKF